MDPVTLIGLVEGSFSLAVQCGSVAKRLNNIAGQLKYAKLTVSTMVQNLDIMQLAWDRIGAWSKDFMPTDNDAFTQRLERFLETGSLVLDALEEDLRSYDVSNMNFTQRSRLVWNETLLHGHQSRIRDQAQSMSLLLQAIQLPTQQATTNLLQQSKKQFLKSDESAFSIVPSRLSVSTGRTSNRESIRSYASMVYRRLSFEDDLFTARVYKRNYRSLRSKQLSKQEPRDLLPSVFANKDRILQRLADGSSTTTDISSETAHKDADIYAEVDAEIDVDIDAEIDAENDAEIDTNQPLFGVITVSTSYDVSTEEVTHNLDYRVASTFHREGFFVRLARNLEQRLNPSVSASYMRLVTTCGRGDNESVKRQLAMMPPTTLKSPEIPALLGSYISGSFYFCPIHAAVFNGHVEVMKTLLRRAALENDLARVVEKVVGGTENDPWRPLHVATLKGNLGVVRLLLENGASVLSTTGYGIQAVHLAAGTGSMEILEALFAAGADLNCTDLYGRQPLHYILDFQDRPDIIEVLVKEELVFMGSIARMSSRRCTSLVRTTFPGFSKLF